eukprot:CCRYP_017784-RA/>CCRYP_017784-RA protein AED:0.00 eAED:0.00 QI:178/1/1/1/0/0/2/92/79
MTSWAIICITYSGTDKVILISFKFKAPMISDKNSGLQFMLGYITCGDNRCGAESSLIKICDLCACTYPDMKHLASDIRI